MIFLFDEEAGAAELSLRGDAYKYLVKVRRHGVGERIAMRRPDAASWLCSYEIAELDGRRARLVLMERREEEVRPPRSLHIGWCIVDPKSVEKVLPQLNELGVGRITFVEAARSQKQFRPDTERYERILRSSMQQCGRTAMMQFGTASGVAAFLQTHPETLILDFSEQRFDASAAAAETVLIGPEGGFSAQERAAMDPARIFRLDTPMVMRSESAAAAVSAMLLL